VIDPDIIHALAEELRQAVRSQNWHPFLMYEGRHTEIVGPYAILGNCIVVTGCEGSIDCFTGEIVFASGVPATDAAVLNLYTNARVYDFGANAELMLNYMRDHVGF
jgi:hypothetical protein